MAENQAARGLCKIVPAGDEPDNTTLDIVAIHGLETHSPRTWEFKNEDQNTVNWLSDQHMLPAEVSNAAIFTYDWNAKTFEDAPVQTLHGHAETLLDLMGDYRRRRQASGHRPIIFIASCFGGIVLAEAINMSSQAGSRHRQIFYASAGIVFLGTPFRGSEAASQAQWQVFVAGIRGKQSSDQLIEALNHDDKELQKITLSFSEIVRRETVRIPIHCFYEMRKTELLRAYLPSDKIKLVPAPFRQPTKKILVTQNSACPDSFERSGLDATHSMMNKFDSPSSPSFIQVKLVLQRFAEGAAATLKRRIESTIERHWLVPFGRNTEFVSRGSIMDELVARILPSATPDDCQRNAIEGLGGIGKTQLAIEAAYRVRDQDPCCSVYWIPALDSSSFENSYREVGRKLSVPGIEDDKADVRSLVKTALESPSSGSWLLIVDNADDQKLLFSPGNLARCLPFNLNGSILFTTRTHEVVEDLGITPRNTSIIGKMNHEEASSLLRNHMGEPSQHEADKVIELLEIFEYLPLAIRQAAAFISRKRGSITEYLALCQDNDENLIDLLSRDFEDSRRYDKGQNPVVKTFIISFRHILELEPLAAEYLEFMAFLNDKAIPQALLPPAENDIKFTDAIGALKAYAFISERDDPGLYDIHRLVRLSVINYVTHMGQRRKLVSWVLRTLYETHCAAKSQNRSFAILCLPHIQHALGFRTDTDGTEVVASLSSLAGTLLGNLGKYDEAARELFCALELCQNLVGEADSRSLLVMDQLGSFLQVCGRREQVKRLRQQSLKFHKQLYGEDHKQTLSAMTQLGLTHIVLREFDEAGVVLSKTVDKYRELFGLAHPDTLNSMINYSIFLREIGSLETAKNTLHSTLHMSRKICGEEDDFTRKAQTLLGKVLMGLKKFEEAEKIQRDVLNVTRGLLGKEDQNTLGVANDLALTMHLAGKYEEAKQWYRYVVEVSESAWGEDALPTCYAMKGIARVLASQSKHLEAELLFRQCLESEGRASGKDSSRYLGSSCELGASLYHLEKYDEAESMLRETRESMLKLGMESDAIFTDTTRWLVLLLEQTERGEEASRLRESLDASKKSRG